MASKEVMVSAPLMVLLFERTFVAGSLANALRRSWPLYVGLVSTWLLLVVLNIHGPRGDSAGFGKGPSLLTWWLTQSQVLVMYFKLIVWPHPLLIHYQLPYLTTLAESWMYVVPVVLLGVVTLVLLWRNAPVGYLLTWIFVILSPTSVVPIFTEMAAQRRMYLPLAAVVVLLVVGGYVAAEAVFKYRVGARQTSLDLGMPRWIAVAPVLVVALALGLVSANRVRAYQDPIGLWRDVVRFEPSNALAHGNLGSMLANAGRRAEAIEELQAAVSRQPDFPTALCNLGQALTDAGRLPEAFDTLNAMLALHPDSPVALNNLGIALTRAGRLPEAITQLEHAVQVAPDYQMAHSNLGAALAGVGRTPEAIGQFRRALQINPNEANAQQSLGMLLAMSGEREEAVAHLREAIRLRPEFTDAHTALGQVLQQTGRLPEAIEHYETVVRLQPESWQAYANVAQALAAADRSKDAIASAEKAIEAARHGGQEAGAQQVEEWLGHYRTELRRAADAAPADSPAHVSESCAFAMTLPTKLAPEYRERNAPTVVDRRRFFAPIGLALILLTTFVVYLPARNGGLLVDDDLYITKPELQSLDGLNRIWFDPSATAQEQYYPLVHTAFWLEHQLWGEAYIGYHLVNVLWHLLAVALVYAILTKLKIPGAFGHGHLCAASGGRRIGCLDVGAEEHALDRLLSERVAGVPWIR